MSDTTGTPQGETASVGTTESSATLEATGSVPEPAKQLTQTSEVDPAELARKVQQLEMERNQLRNKTEKYEQEAEVRRQAELTETQQLQEKIASLEAKDAKAEAQKLRDQFVNDYPDELTREAARRLISKNETNLVWGDVNSVEDAKADITAQLDALKEVINPNGTVGAPSVRGNNPAPQQTPPPDRKALLDEAVKSKDFSELIKQIPSVQGQIGLTSKES